MPLTGGEPIEDCSLASGVERNAFDQFELLPDSASALHTCSQCLKCEQSGGVHQGHLLFGRLTSHSAWPFESSQSKFHGFLQSPLHEGCKSEPPRYQAFLQRSSFDLYIQVGDKQVALPCSESTTFKQHVFARALSHSLWQVWTGRSGQEGKVIDIRELVPRPLSN